MNDIVIRIGGEAGMGLESSGAGFSLALTRGGRHVFGLPNYMSRIRGGHNFFSVRVADRPLHGPRPGVHLLLALNVETIERHVDEIVEGGAVVYDAKEELPDELRRDGVNFFPVPLDELAEEKGGRKVMRNTLTLGVAAGLLDFDPGYLESVIRDNFAAKGQKVIDGNLKVNAAGVEAAQEFKDDFPFRMPAEPDAPERLVLNGNTAFAMGALAGGCRFASGYPMTPGSPVLIWLAQHMAEYGAVVKHAEDEISGLLMAIGAAHMGARALVPTSGGGYSLMVEATGLAGITETPVVIYNAQRPGPATGLPTRTEQGDMLFMLHASQGEFPRIMLAPANVEDAFHVGWQSFNLAERYQTPVMVLSDHFLADSFRTIEKDALDFDAVTFDRGKLLSEEELDALDEKYQRFKVTEDGVSPRALPGHSNAVWVTSGNEHDEYGRLDEGAQNRIDQVDKRMRKQQGMREDVPPPTWYGPDDAETTLVCWGSTYGPAREAVDQSGGALNLLHFSGLEPFPPAAEDALDAAGRTVMVEQNATGQLESLIRMRTGRSMDANIRKYDGRAFTAAYILEHLA